MKSKQTEFEVGAREGNVGCPLWVISGRSPQYCPNGRFRAYSGHRTTDWRAQKNPAQDRAFDFLVAGARYENYMQIEIEPFPLVA